ncbi:hypothetical protein [Paenibacillus mendelii]|uniref:Uncharacterized protein n=1 Tax=Paenibacillus mendelii TaxID=206163 RepID=A0ABV6JHG1_9BACL|nr:hypothetical protein [Paenibacillus mendelii]MCQ6558215.1 hypothetical protein [Paenibacillus mendelii]
MRKVIVLIGCLLLCSGCTDFLGRSTKTVQSNTVMMEVYPESESVLGSVYEGPESEKPLNPKLPDTVADPYAAPLTDS